MSEPAQKRLTDLDELEPIAVEVARFLHERRAQEIVVLRVRDLLPFASYFVIASAGSTRAAQSLADGTERILKPKPLPRLGVHGRREGRWICLDYAEIVIHIFEADARAFYDLDNLWSGAQKVALAFGPRVDEQG